MADSVPTKDLLTAWRSGHRAALEALIEQSREFVRRHVRAHLGARLRARGDEEDYVQEVMLRAVAFAPSIEPCDTKQLHALLTRIADNALRDLHEHHGAQRRSAERETLLTPSELDRPVEGATTPSGHAVRREDQAWVRLAVELLDPEDRVVVMRHQWYGETFAAIGERLGIGENGARMRFQRALPKLLRKVKALRSGQSDGAPPGGAGG
jgi:RNA polymerase sigma factor (sigma-70 family)